MVAANNGNVQECDVPLRYQPEFVAGNYDLLLPRALDDSHIGITVGAVDERVSRSETPWQAPGIAGTAGALLDPALSARAGSVPHAGDDVGTNVGDGDVHSGGGGRVAIPARSQSTAQDLTQLLLEWLQSQAGVPGGDVSTAYFAAAAPSIVHLATDVAHHKAFADVFELGRHITGWVLSSHDKHYSTDWAQAVASALPGFRRPPELTFHAMRDALRRSLGLLTTSHLAIVRKRFEEFQCSLPPSMPGDHRQKRQFHSRNVGPRY